MKNSLKMYNLKGSAKVIAWEFINDRDYIFYFYHLFMGSPDCWLGPKSRMKVKLWHCIVSDSVKDETKFSSDQRNCYSEPTV